MISNNELVFYVLTSFVTSFYFLKTIFKHSQIVFLSVFIYFSQFYFISYNAIRQFIAISLFLYFGDKFLAKKKYVLFILLILVLAQIHFSIYLLVFFPLLGVKNFNKGKYFMIWGISFILFLVQSNNFLDLSAIFSLIPNLSSISAKFDMLEAGSNFFFGKYGSNNQLIVKNIFFILFLIRLKYYLVENRIYWFNLFLFGLMLQNLLVKFSLFAVRIAYYGDIAQLFIVPIYIQSFKSKNHRVLMLLFFFLYYSLNFYLRFVVNGESEVFKQDVEWMK